VKYVKSIMKNTLSQKVKGLMLIRLINKKLIITIAMLLHLQ